jgi:hypothetical protein
VDEYGNLVRVWIANQPQVFINQGNAAEKILQGMQHHAKSTNYHFFDAWMGEGLLTSQGTRLLANL